MTKEQLNKVTFLTPLQEVCIIQEIENTNKGVIIQKAYGDYYIHVDFIISEGRVSSVVDVLDKEATIVNINSLKAKVSFWDLKQFEQKTKTLYRMYNEALKVLVQNGIFVYNEDKFLSIVELRYRKVIYITAKDLDFTGCYSNFTCYSDITLIGMQGTDTKLCFFHVFDSNGDVGEFYLYSKDLYEFFKDHEFKFSHAVLEDLFKEENNNKYDFMKKSIEIIEGNIIKNNINNK